MTPDLPERRTLVPAKDCRVRKPDGSLLADAGEDVVVDTYWRRRIEHGDVVDKTPAPKTPGKAEA